MQVPCLGSELGVICRVADNLEQATVPGFRDALALAQVPLDRAVVFDLLDIPFIDSAGLRLRGTSRRLEPAETGPWTWPSGTTLSGWRRRRRGPCGTTEQKK
jgi:hypothetical protein